MRGDMEPMDLVAARYGKILKAKDPQAIALDTFHQLDSMRPVDLDRWTYKDPEEKKQDAERMKRNEYPPPRTAHQRKCDIADGKAECTRRLRSTMWAEVTLRGTKHASYSDMLAAFHREQWGITRVSSDSAKRESQMAYAVWQKTKDTR